MKNFKLIASDLDVAASLAEIAAQPEMWKEITLRQSFPGSVHHDTEAIHLRVPTETTPEAILESLQSLDNVPTLQRLPATCALVAGALKAADMRQLGRVMVVNLKAGGAIDPHIDGGAYAAHFDRFHMVLTSADGNIFHCGDESVHMRAGEFWCFNHHIEHHVLNRSSEDRLHIIIDALLGHWPEKAPAVIGA